MKKRTGIILDPIYRDHRSREGHPESPERYDCIVEALSEHFPEKQMKRIKPYKASEDELGMCHAREYIEIAKEDIASGSQSLSTGDTDICSRSYEVALFAAGGVITAVDAVIKGEVRNAFCPVRPPGHHATPSRGMGFCVFNNIAIGAKHAQVKHGVEKVLIVDWDVHHGNGTQEIFYSDPSVFYFSTHQWPCYPGTGTVWETGEGKGKGYTLNCPFAPGACGRDIIGAFREKLIPAMREYRPEMVFISAGFDSREDDTIGAFFLTDSDFGVLTDIVLDIAGKYAGGRLVSVLEGGYNLSGLASASVTHVRHLAEQ